MATCAFAACGGGGETSVESSSSMEQPALSFTENKVELILGQTKQVPALSLQDGETVTYSSNDESIAIVSQTGLVEGEGIGSAVVKATTSTGRIALVQIIVYDPEYYPVPYISVAQDNFALCVGDSFALAYTYTYLNQEVDGEVSVSADNDAVVVIEGELIKAVGVGEATVTISGVSTYGTATKTVKISVTEKQAEFSASFVGKEIYVGNNIELAMYVHENDEVKKVDGAVFSVADEGIAAIENGELVPLAGGDTEISVNFAYGEKSYSKQIPIHIYGYKTCSFYYSDGSLDHSFQAVYGDVVPLYIENKLGNPEYNKTIKCWYINGEKVKDEEFTMPDEDVEVFVKYVNETEDDFTSSFSEGHLLSDAQAVVAYVDEPFVDKNGVSSDLNGYMQFTANFSSLSFNFDEPVVVNDYAKVKIKMYVPEHVSLLYFGYATSENWSKENPTKRYEASAGVHKTGDVPLAIIPNDEWTILELPLSVFVDEIGDTLKGISLAISNASIYIDYIALDVGLAVNDPVYMDNVLMQDITDAENGSEAQATAIAAYKKWSKTLTDEQKATDAHQANVATINALLKEYFAAREETKALSNKATITASGTTISTQAYNVVSHWGNAAQVAFQTATYQKMNLAQFASAASAYTATFTLPTFDFTQYKEAYFGFTAATAAGDAKVTINGKSYDQDVNDQYFYVKMIIKGDALTVVGDGANNVGHVYITTKLNDAILKGEEALTIEWKTAGWSQVEVTEMHATEIIPWLYDEEVINIPNGWGTAGTRVDKFVTKYSGTYQKTFDNSCDFMGDAVLTTLNYNAYDEVYFGLHAIAGARSWTPYDGDNGVITINGVSYEIDPHNGDYFFKISVKNGVLTMIVEKANNVTPDSVALQVALPESVLNGKDALVIEILFGGAWSQAEITEIHTLIAMESVD